MKIIIIMLAGTEAVFVHPHTGGKGEHDVALVSVPDIEP
jgi:hypothetical protein